MVNRKETLRGKCLKVSADKRKVIMLPGEMGFICEDNVNGTGL